MKFSNEIILRITEVQIKQLIDISRRAFPNECAGLIFGEIIEKKLDKKGKEPLVYSAERVEEFTSSELSPVSFLIEDYEQLYLKWKEAQDQGLKLLCIYHSHPNTAYPSGKDLFYMKNMGSVYPNILWLIYGNKSKEFACFYLKENKSKRRIKIEIE